MKKISFLVILCFSTAVSFSQTISWSPELVAPKEKNLFTGLSFPGSDANYYYVNEAEAGGVSLDRKITNYLKTVDKTTLKVVKETILNSAAGGEGKDYVTAASFVVNNKQYSFFLTTSDKDVYRIYSSIQGMDGAAASALKEIQKVDASKFKPFASASSPLADKMSSKMATYMAAINVQIKPAYDKRSILSALIYETVDKNNSMLNISEWDENLKATVSNNYNIPFAAKQLTQKTIFGSMGLSGGNLPHVVDFAKDNNGVVYVLLESADPKNEEDFSRYWIYQFKLSDPSYTKVFKKEFVKNIASVQAALFQDESGKVYVSNIGKEIEKDNDKTDIYHVNTAVIGSFYKEGNLETLLSGALTAEMMYNFEEQKKVDKKGHINSLRIKNILPAADGGCFVVWQHEWTEEGNHSDFEHLDHVLVQRYSNANKLLWEKPIYKNQTQKSGVQSIYAGITVFTANNNLYIIYPDDPKNAAKAIDDRDASEFSVVKFGNKDLAGFFVASIDTKGTYTRKYINWPDDKIGFAVCINSFKNVGNNEFIGTARKISQGAITLKSEEYSFFKLKLQ